MFFAFRIQFQGGWFVVVRGLDELQLVSVMESNGDARKRNASKIRTAVVEQRIDHAQNDRLARTVGTVQQSYTVIQLEVDAVIVDAEEPVDLDSFEPSEFGFIH